MQNQKFNSPSTGEECTAAQLIAEIMVQREIHKKKAAAPHKWWNHDPWKKKYAFQVIAANGLLKLYEPLAILNALKRKECNWQWSLRTKGLNDIFKEEQAKLDNLRKRAEESKREFSSTVTTEIKKFGKESKLNKLRD